MQIIMRQFNAAEVAQLNKSIEQECCLEDRAISGSRNSQTFIEAEVSL
jgi:hypothetical protein